MKTQWWFDLMHSGPDWLVLIPAWTFLIADLPLLLLARRILRKAGQLNCRECGYSLRGLPESIAACPECGAARDQSPRDTLRG